MTQHEAAEEPRAAVSPPVFRFNGYGVPVDAGAVEPEPEPDPVSPYSYDAYGPAVDPYVEHVPYDQPVAAYSYGLESTAPLAPAEPPAPPEPEPTPVAWSEPPAPAAPEPEPEPTPVTWLEPTAPAAPEPEPEPTPVTWFEPPASEPEPEPTPVTWFEPTAPAAPEPEPEPTPVAWLEPTAEPPAPPAPEPAAQEMPWRPELPRQQETPWQETAWQETPWRSEPPWRPEVPAHRFEPGPAVAPVPERRRAPIASVPAYAEQPYVHAYITAEAPAHTFTGPAPVPWPTGPRADRPAPLARQAYRPGGRAVDRAADETRERTWALVSHIGGLLTGFVVPLVAFLVYRKRSQFLREHTTEALNFQLMLTIVYVAGAALTVLSFGVVVLTVAWAFAVTCGTLGALAANDGDRFRYPVNLRVIA